MLATLATHDRDLVRWGLNLLDGGGGFFDTVNNNYTSTPVYTYQNEDPEPQVVNSYRNGDPNPPLINLTPPLSHLSPPEVHSNVANDEAIARTLQEELTKLAEEEAAAARKTSRTLDDGSKAAVLSQDWRGRPFLNGTEGDSIIGPGPDRKKHSSASGSPEGENERQTHGRGGGYQERGCTDASQSTGAQEDDTVGPQKQSSSSGSKGTSKGSNLDYDSYQHGDDDDNLTLALALSEDEHRYDEEVAKRLTKLDSIRHIPRTNTDEIPTLDAASLDHARLMERLVLYGLNEQKIQGDGNCQFRALSDQLYRTPDHHKLVRKNIVTQLKGRSDAYSGYVPMAYSEYLKKMSKSGEWGDHVTLQAAADYYGVKIWLITSFKETSFIEILPFELMSNRVIYLSFWAEVHYNSIYPEGDLSFGIEAAPKKKHWLLKSIF